MNLIQTGTSNMHAKTHDLGNLILQHLITSKCFHQTSTESQGRQAILGYVREMSFYIMLTRQRSFKPVKFFLAPCGKCYSLI